MTTAVQEKGTVIVTGASRGIGAAIAERLAGDGYGVVVNYSADADGAESVVSAIQANDGRAVAERADVSSEEDIEAMFDRANDELGPVTGLVNNAGTLGEEIDEQEVDVLTRLMQVNVVGPMVCSKHPVRRLV
jgi:NAD(P)-dependent dehydrogenase (short-subunit alcohol dehydrogenase family)